jgi:hypothetical protein
VRAWGAFEKASGEGEEESGFENWPASEEFSFGVWLDYGLDAHDRFQNTPRLRLGERRMPGARLSGTFRGRTLDVSMYFDGTRYLKLDGLDMAEATVRLDLVPVRWGSIFGGWQRYRIEHDGDSFFDVWPFTVWDVFTAKRYRLGVSDAQLDAWYAGVGVLAEGRKYEIDLTTRFEWWEDQGVLNLLERIDDLFPFFFHYERTANDLDVSSKYAVQIDPSFVFRPATGVSLRLSGRIAFPFGSESAGGGGTGGGGGPGEPEEPSGRSVHGGVEGRLELIVTL